ncbi:hypothetical protein DPX16_8925 [Anabarilius grahami]|uniref:Uncharacterized protein n=1 Tax=Anabarilius grahami TaxID=495550 RepID=A0A3N0ZAL8_ANAGA|nr:hypothetical protein DPX16_8925 [Anabarilius grahami]
MLNRPPKKPRRHLTRASSAEHTEKRPDVSQHLAEDSVAKTAMRIDPVGHRPRGQPKKRWMDRIKEDLKIDNASPEDALDRPKWRRLCQRADPAIAGATPG